MAKRIEPFRDYSEHEVINLFSLKLADDANFQLLVPGGDGGDFDSGVVVAAETDAKLPGDLPSKLATGTSFRSYLGMTPAAGVGVGFNAYPVNDMNVIPADAANVDTLGPIGITLKETLAYDENGENLLRYAVKKDELQCVLPGQTVPILTRGMVLLSSSAFEDGAAPAVGNGLSLGTDAGGLTDAGKFAVGVPGAGDVGRIIAQNQTGDKWLCKLSF
jgi:hypothetical protein